jgi:hypothetical protein
MGPSQNIILADNTSCGDDCIEGRLVINEDGSVSVASIPPGVMGMTALSAAPRYPAPTTLDVCESDPKKPKFNITSAQVRPAGTVQLWQYQSPTAATSLDPAPGIWLQVTLAHP